MSFNIVNRGWVDLAFVVDVRQERGLHLGRRERDSLRLVTVGVRLGMDNLKIEGLINR